MIAKKVDRLLKAGIEHTRTGDLLAAVENVEKTVIKTNEGKAVLSDLEEGRERSGKLVRH